VSRDQAIWHVPLLVVAGIAGLLGVAVGVAMWRHALPDELGGAIQWGLAGACVTFTMARVIHQGRVTRRELELFLLGGAAVVAEYVIEGAAVIAAIAVVGLIWDEIGG
jgi:hypothetical protein